VDHCSPSTEPAIEFEREDITTLNPALCDSLHTK
jgi:hypothetical protein